MPLHTVRSLGEAAMEREVVCSNQDIKKSVINAYAYLSYVNGLIQVIT